MAVFRLKGRFNMRNRLVRGFTLIELLVVISIVAILVAMILPAIGRAKDIAVSTQCQSQMRQLAIGLHTYATDFKGGYVPYPMDSMFWMYQSSAMAIAPYFSGESKPLWYCPNIANSDLPIYGYAPQSWGTPLYSHSIWQIGYFYLAQPTAEATPPNQWSQYYIDTDGDGSKTDEYLTNIYQTDVTVSEVVIVSDSAGQPNIPNAWRSMHPFRPPNLPGNFGGVNTLFGDGHARFKKSSEVRGRWYAPLPAGW